MATEGELSHVLAHNIRALIEMRRREDRNRSLQLRTADAIMRFTGSIGFIWVHVALVAAWLLINNGVLGVRPFDPAPFTMLAMVASVEAIFLSTCVLVTQNRMASASERRAELDLQISLLSEHEITRLVRMVDAIAARVGVEGARDPELAELKEDVEPERVLEEL